MGQKITWKNQWVATSTEPLEQGKIIFSPTKIGYIIMATTLEGLQRKFEATQRKQNKPTVVLCSSLSASKVCSALRRNQAFFLHEKIYQA